MNSPGVLVLDSDTSITVDTGTPQISRNGEQIIFNQSNVPSGFTTLTSSSANINVVSFIMLGTGGTPTFIDDFTFARGSAAAVPEPASFALAGLGLLALKLRRRKK